jgi:hypothetical protein
LGTQSKEVSLRFAFAFLTLATGIGSPALSLKAQIILPTVTVHTDKLPQEDKDYISDLDNKLQQMIVEYSWTDGKHRYKLPIQVDIYFDTYSRDGAYRRYSAGLLTALKSGIQLRDKRWDFRFLQGERFNFGEPYHTLAGAVEYCIYICLGFEADRISLLGGSQYYEKARLVGERARSETDYSSGWDVRRELAFELTDTTYNSIRKARFYAEAGTYFADRENWVMARSNLSRAVAQLIVCPPSQAELHRNDDILRFVDLDSLATMLKAAQMNNELRQLAIWDREGADRYK